MGKMKLLGVILVLGMSIWGCRGERGAGDKAMQSETARVVSGNAELFTRSMGQGPPLLIVHGGPGLDHSYFLPQMQGLARDHQLIFYDQRCSGRSQSDLLPEQVRLDAFIEDIEAIRRHYGLGQVNLLGHSFGGVLAMQYALRYPDRLRCLILSNSQGASSEARNEENARLARRTDEAYQVKMDSIRMSPEFQAGNARAYEAFFRHLFSIEFYRPELAEELNISLPDEFLANSELLQNLYLDLASYDFHDELDKVKAPTLLVFGDYEPLADLVGPKLQAAFPNAITKRIPKCGHFPFIEQPDDFFRLIRNFVAAADE